MPLLTTSATLTNDVINVAVPTAIVQIQALGFPWPTVDPFLFCVHHDDAYPAGNAELGPAIPLAGRNIGQDFSGLGGLGGWSMYHGATVPGFPGHPHRGFETVTITRQGLIDHADSLGAAARFGGGDTQWLSAGGGVVHSEMFPLLDPSAPNPLELFQIWLNLPAAHKMVPAHFTMLWREKIPTLVRLDANGRTTQVAVIAGALAGAGQPLSPPPDSWASQPGADVAIWTLRMAPGAQFTLPPAQPGTRRNLYFFKGASLRIDGQTIAQHAAIELRGDAVVMLENGDVESEFLMLQGRPIAEPVVQHGPFVMNTAAEIKQAIADYQRTQFGGWPWPRTDPVNGSDPARFARHPDGREERPAASVVDATSLKEVA